MSNTTGRKKENGVYVHLYIHSTNSIPKKKKGKKKPREKKEYEEPENSYQKNIILITKISSTKGPK